MDDSDYARLPIYQEQLAAALGFSQVDLEFNRAGRLSSNQASTLMRDVASRVVGSVLALLFSIACLTWGAMFSGAFLALGAIAGLACLLLAAKAVQLSQDQRSGRVSKVEGWVQSSYSQEDVASRYGPRSTFLSFRWQVAGQMFRVPGKPYAALVSARHRLYFLPVTRRVISAEPLLEKRALEESSNDPSAR